ncbi:ty3-gypsy retrotransposon protein [Cucumis melo var. makuwa]|uniref:Ty3-gypsy retrotransposon protein n=1 Tax=Cucumis melo var. makuwa TaxID=1194695 RepID=A0A5D3CP99_CUCMM|nr:ty3-gypsy retrotransposon protein [Cucumis melo var. makuwa]TYK12226.1 ty3-gypsy retrotransposon protein [Cucumis melo var. makuwa]
MVTIAEKVSPHQNNSNAFQSNAREEEADANNPFGDGLIRSFRRDEIKELRLCVVSDDIDDAEMEDIVNEGAMVEVSPVVELSLNLVVGLTASGTFKVKSMVEDREIVIMIACGATHNFISLKLVEELNIPIVETTNYGSLWASGRLFRGEESAKGSQWGYRC